MPGNAEALVVQLFDPSAQWVSVGILTHTSERSTFRSFDSYWNLGRRPVLGQVFEENGPSWSPTSRVRLPKWFSHLLPEGRLREAIAEAADVNAVREFFLLRRIGGDDLPGGIRVVEDAAGDDDGTGAEEAPAPQVVVSDLGPLKFSLAGIQLKFSVRNTDRGLTVPASGEAGDWIAKLPDPRQGFEGVPEAELAGLELARAAGITVPRARLVDVDQIERIPEWATVGGGRALLVERYDRTPSGGRVHTEELAQILDLPTGDHGFKYQFTNFETVARTAASLSGVGAIGEVIDRIVLNVLLGNGDAHAKNWSFWYPDGQHPQLSPAYDIVPTVLYVKNDDLGMNLGRSKRFDDVSLETFGRLAEKAGWDWNEGVTRASEAVARTREAWSVLGDLLPPDVTAFLTERRDSLPLARSAA